MRNTSIALLVVLTLILVGPAMAAPQLFTPHTIADDFAQAVSVYAADLDGDNDNDVLGAAFVGNDIAWWENTLGDGTEWARHTIDADFGGARRVHAADLDGDGWVDVVAAASHDDEITWWRNTQTLPIVFEEYSIDKSFAGARCVYAADLNGDDRPDILGAADRDDQIVWWENDPSSDPLAADPIAWTLHSIKGGFDRATSVHAADMNGDSYVDVLATSFGLDDVTLWLNDGGDPPNWMPIPIDDSFDGAMQVFAAKIDEDNYPDIVASATTADEIKWWKNDGGNTPGFTPYTIQSGFDMPYEVYAADVDGDGDNDVLAAACAADSITWWENRLDEALDWQPHGITDSFDCAISVFPVELNDDDGVDILGGANFANQIVWWENLGPPTVTASVDIHPNTLNLKSNGRWVTAYIELPEGYDVGDIDVGTVLLEDSIPAASYPTSIGDHDHDGVPDLMVKFSRADLIAYLKANGLTSGDVELSVTGYVDDVLFKGTDSIRVK